MPLNWWAIPPAPPLQDASETAADAVEPEAPRGAMLILAFFFSATRFVSGAFSAHLPGLLQGAGATEIAAIAAGALVGPAQVGARLVEFGLLRSFHPLVSARIAAVLHPIGAGFLVVFGPVAAPVFAIFHGAGNGMITIAKGTLPLGDLRAGRIRAAQRPPIGADPHRRSERAAAVRPAARPHRRQRGAGIGRALPRRLRLAAAAAGPPGARQRAAASD